MSGRHRVCALAELAPGERRIVDVDGESIGLFNCDGELFALRNLCPHGGAPLCKGALGGTLLPAGPDELEYGREGEILRCPWHGLEIDIRTGRPLAPVRYRRVKTYELEIEDGYVVLVR